MNVNDTAQTELVLGGLRKQFGEISILVNNAGITRDNLLARMTDEEWDDVLATNLRSVFRLSRAVLRAMMRARAGRIISISSVIGSMGNAGQANYAASKAGMVGFTKSLAQEIGSRNITVNCVAPGFVDTDMTNTLGEEQRAKLVEHVPLKRLGRPEPILPPRLHFWQPGRVLYHRGHPACQRRDVHGVIPIRVGVLTCFPRISNQFRTVLYSLPLQRWEATVRIVTQKLFPLLPISR